MPTAQMDAASVETRQNKAITEAQYEKWAHWPIHWSAVWVGALAAVAAVLLFGLIGVALGAHLLGPEHRVVDLKKLGLGALAFSVFAAFLSFVIGAWVAGRVAGILRSEPAILHGAIVWLVAVPILVVMAGLGAGNSFGAWYAGLAGSPAAATAVGAPFDRPEPLGVTATEEEKTQFKAEQAEYRRNVKQWQEDTPKVTRNSALGAVTALLLGLIGSVIGGWMASGEPMTLSHHRNRSAIRSDGHERP